MKLNYNHLRYFHEVAFEGNLTRAAERLNISQSALSIQIKQLEERLGHDLFDRTGKRMMLTEAGRIALDHAERIFTTGDDLLTMLEQKRLEKTPLRIGAISTLSRNFQMRFIKPLLSEHSSQVVLKSGSSEVLYRELSSLAIDVVLTTEPPMSVAEKAFEAKLLDRQPVSLIGKPDWITDKELLEILQTVPLIVPTDNPIRTGLARLTAELNIKPTIAAEVDDMAMVRLLTRAGFGVALAPAVVLADEIEVNMVVQAPFDLEITEEFYAVTTERLFPHHLLDLLLA